MVKPITDARDYYNHVKPHGISFLRMKQFIAGSQMVYRIIYLTDEITDANRAFKADSQKPHHRTRPSKKPAVSPHGQEIAGSSSVLPLPQPGAITTATSSGWSCHLQPAPAKWGSYASQHPYGSWVDPGTSTIPAAKEPNTLTITLVSRGSRSEAKAVPYLLNHASAPEWLNHFSFRTWATRSLGSRVRVYVFTLHHLWCRIDNTVGLSDGAECQVPYLPWPSSKI